MLIRLVLAALLFPMLQAVLFGLGVTAVDLNAWVVADPIQQTAVGAALLALPLAWGFAPCFLIQTDDRLDRRVARLARRRLRPAEVRWPPRP